MNLLPQRRLLFVHAHPDDESIGTGATMAKYAAEGAHVALVTCTRGEEGEVIPADLRHLAADREDRLGEQRIAELAAACRALGVTDQRFLAHPGRWRDSGMMGAPSNANPACFWRADVDEAAAELVPVIREIRPQVLVTYDANGLYGHPDHIKAHQVAWRAFELAADSKHGEREPWQVDKFYAMAVPRSAIAAGLAEVRAADLGFATVESVDELPFGIPDEAVTTVIDARDHLEAKLAALRAHRSQIRVRDHFFALSNGIGQVVSGVEYYTLLAGERRAIGVGGRETDFFAAR